MKSGITYKNIGVAVLLCALFIQSFTRVLLISDYYVNTDDYAINCVNKELVELQCFGQCQLMKKLEKENKKDQGNPQRNLENNNKYFLSQELISAELIPVEIEKQHFALLPDPKTIDRPHTLFRPPAV